MGTPVPYLTELRLQSIRCFDEATIRINPRWTIIVGDNGTGKSSLLRCVGIFNEDNYTSNYVSSADSFGAWERDGSTSARITAEFAGGGNAQVAFEGIDSSRRGSSVPAYNDSRSNPLPIYSYGPIRNAAKQRSSAPSGPYSLFSPAADLLDPELTLYRYSRGSKIGPDDLLRWLETLLELESGSMKLNSDGLAIEFLRRSQKFTSLGEGYKSTLVWILDFIGQYLERRGLKTLPEAHEICATVVVDELEQHLHPSWQRRIVGLLSRQFPNVQFIVSTHSPLVIIGATDLEDDEVDIVLLQPDEGIVSVIDELKPPRGLRADQVLTSYLFGLTTTGDDQTQDEVERLSKLLSRDQKDEEAEVEIQKLRLTLNEKLSSEETTLGRKVKRVAEAAFERSTRDLVSTLDEAEKMELRRQLTEF